MSGSSHRRAPLRVPASSARALTTLLLRLTPRIVGSEARSMLIAAPELFWKVLPVTMEVLGSVGLLVWIRSPAALELRTTLLVRDSSALLTTTSAADSAPP